MLITRKLIAFILFTTCESNTDYSNRVLAFQCWGWERVVYVVIKWLDHFKTLNLFFFFPCSDKLQQWLGGQLRLRWRGQATHCGGGQPAGAWGYRCWWNHIAGQPWPWRHRNSITPQRVLEWRWGTSHEACVFSTATGAFQGVFTPAVFSFFESNSGADQNNCIETFFFEDVAEDVGVAVL